jgi:hypothetical protein
MTRRPEPAPPGPDASKPRCAPWTLTGEDRASRPRPRRAELTDADREAIHAAIDALPPMTDEQIEAIAEVIIAARERRRHTRPTSRGPPLPPDADALAGQRPRKRVAGQP